MKIHEHHIHPKFMDNKEGKGKKYDLSKKNHMILHSIIPSIIWKYIPKENKQNCISHVISFSKYFITNLKKNNNVDLKKILQNVKYKNILKYFICEGYLLDKESLEYLKETEKIIKPKQFLKIYREYYPNERQIKKCHLIEIMEEFEKLNDE